LRDEQVIPSVENRSEDRIDIHHRLSLYWSEDHKYTNHRLSVYRSEESRVFEWGKCIDGVGIRGEDRGLKNNSIESLVDEVTAALSLE
jgi:hypothetical protein